MAAAAAAASAPPPPPVSLDSKDMFQVKGKNIVVTGGGRGIGAMIAEAFVRADPSNTVWVVSRDLKACQDTADTLNALGRGKCMPLSFDLATVKGCNELAAALPAHVHVLVNNSGYAWGEPLNTFSEKGWDRVMDLNVKGLFFLTKALLPNLRAAAHRADPARIINIGSVAGLLPQPAPTYSYDLSKKAVHYLTLKLAGELAHHQITCNAIAPGLVPTKMSSQLGDQQQLVKHVPMGRAGQPADMGGCAVFLSSPAAAWITGAIIPVDGGQTAFRGVRAKL